MQTKRDFDKLRGTSGTAQTNSVLTAAADFRRGGRKTLACQKWTRKRVYFWPFFVDETSKIRFVFLSHALNNIDFCFVLHCRANDIQVYTLAQFKIIKISLCHRVCGIIRFALFYHVTISCL